MIGMKEFLSYGSLREGFYNFNKFSAEGEVRRVGGGIARGVDLYYNKEFSYPEACKGRGSVVVDIIRTDETTYNRMAQMEIEAGYVESSIYVNGKAYPIFLSKEVPESPWKMVTDMEVADWAIVANKLFEPGERGRYQKSKLKST